MNYIDTRDLAKRKDELEDLKTAIDTAKDDLDGAGYPLGTPRDQIKEDDWHLIEALIAMDYSTVTYQGTDYLVRS